MSLRDEIGPYGLGKGTSRRRDWCATGMRLCGLGRFAFRGKNRWLLGLAAPLAVAVIKDLVNPRGLLRQFTVIFFRERRMINPQNISGDAEYSIIDLNLHYFF
jgi:hypothetical protein